MSLVAHGHFLDRDHFLENLFAPLGGKSAEDAFFSPRVDIKEKRKFYEISAELPGVKKEDIHLSLDNGILTLEAEANSEDTEEEDGKVIRQERRYGKIVRSFNLGTGVHEEDISASFKDGVLVLKAPKKKDEAPAQRRIAIK